MRLVIANRGEIARRILKAGKQRGFTVAVISTKEDRNSLVCEEADVVLEVSNFLNAQEIVEKSKEFKADLLHPGYGFLSENSQFAHLVTQAGISFVGPTSENMKLMGGKESSKNIAQKCGVPTLNALLSHELKSLPIEQWKEALNKKGIISPYLVKASGGGGGRGMRVVENFEDLPAAVERASEEALSSFSDDTVFVERYLQSPRHIEIQVFGDGLGGGVFWGERECSLQRRHQKVIEESPSSVITPALREKMGRASLALVKETRYRGAGTLEFLMDAQKNFYFLEMNTRLQVEHPVTEMVYGIDLVQAQFDLASGFWPSFFPSPDTFSVPVPHGVALEARILAEDPSHQFLPTPGKIFCYQEPLLPGVRVDTGVKQGNSVNPNYDSMMAKLIVHAPSRVMAAEKLKNALESFPILGFTNNISFLRNIAAHPDFIQGHESTSWIAEHLDALNSNILCAEKMDFFTSASFKEKLSFALSQDAILSGTEEVFAKLSPDYFEITVGPYPQSFVCTHTGRYKNNENTFLFFACRISIEQIQIFYQGQTLSIDCPRRVQFIEKNESTEQGVIKTPMPGKLFNLFVSEGQTVEEKQMLFIVESMKIQFEVKSPFKGIVKNVYVEKDQILSGSDILALIEQEGTN